MTIKLDTAPHMHVRVTENLPEGVIKVKLDQFPKIDYLINKELFGGELS